VPNVYQNGHVAVSNQPDNTENAMFFCSSCKYQLPPHYFDRDVTRTTPNKVCDFCVMEDKQGTPHPTGYGKVWGTVGTSNITTTGMPTYVPIPQCLHAGTPYHIFNSDLTIYASSTSSFKNPFAPDAGFYLADSWFQRGDLVANFNTGAFGQGEIPFMYLEWPDHGDVLLSTLARSLIQVRKWLEGGLKVEVGCIGGHGRTGTVLAALSVIYGATASEAIKHVRQHYCTKAVEGKKQEALIGAIAQTLGRA
jgi:protein-tyrosine phosphatase